VGASRERLPDRNGTSAVPPVTVLTLHDMRPILDLPSTHVNAAARVPGGEQVDVYARAPPARPRRETLM